MTRQAWWHGGDSGVPPTREEDMLAGGTPESPLDTGRLGELPEEPATRTAQVTPTAPSLSRRGERIFQRALRQVRWALLAPCDWRMSVYGPHPTLLALRLLATRYDCSRISGLCLTSISRGRATMGYSRVGSSLLCRASSPWTFSGYSDAGSTCSPSFGVRATVVTCSSISRGAWLQATMRSGS